MTITKLTMTCLFKALIPYLTIRFLAKKKMTKRIIKAMGVNARKATFMKTEGTSDFTEPRSLKRQSSETKLWGI